MLDTFVHALSDNSVLVYVTKINKKTDYQYITYTPTKDTIKVSELPDSPEKSTLLNLSVEEIPLLEKIVCYNRHYHPLRFAIATKPRQKSDYVIAHLLPFANQFTTAQTFQNYAMYIKRLNKYLLYYLGARRRDLKIIKMYVPIYSQSEKLRYHLNIIRQLQQALSEAEYKDLKKTLNLHIENDDICVTFFHHFTRGIVTAHFDFLHKCTETCMNFSKLADDPVGLLISLYLSTKAYMEGENPNEVVEVETTNRELR